MAERCQVDEIVEELIGAPLFAELSDGQIKAVVGRLEGRFVNVRKGDRVFPLHQHASTFGYLVEGRVEMSRTDPWGNKHVVGIVGPGETIGGVLAFSGIETPPAEAIALSDCRLIVFSRDNFVLDVDDPLCPCFGIMMRNFAQIMAASKLDMMEHCYVLSQRSVRKKLLMYLSFARERAGADTFNIPLNRQQLANYLNVDRSVLSVEIGALRASGLVECSGNQFTILRS